MNDEHEGDKSEYGEFDESRPGINGLFLICCVIILQLGAWGFFLSNYYLLGAATIASGLLALFAPWKQKRNGVTTPNKYRIFFGFVFVVGIILMILVFINGIQIKLF
jgi:amino acid permease